MSSSHIDKADFFHDLDLEGILDKRVGLNISPSILIELISLEAQEAGLGEAITEDDVAPYMILAAFSHKLANVSEHVWKVERRLSPQETCYVSISANVQALLETLSDIKENRNMDVAIPLWESQIQMLYVNIVELFDILDSKDPVRIVVMDALIPILSNFNVGTKLNIDKLRLVLERTQTVVELKLKETADK